MKEELSHCVKTIETNSCSNRTRIEALELNHEKLLLTVDSISERGLISKNPAQSKTKNADDIEAKPLPFKQAKGTLKPKNSNGNVRSEAPTT